MFIKLVKAPINFNKLDNLFTQIPLCYMHNAIILFDLIRFDDVQNVQTNFDMVFKIHICMRVFVYSYKQF